MRSAENSVRCCARRSGSSTWMRSGYARITPFVPEMKSGQKSVIFGDLSFYWIGDRQGITFKRLNERYADTGQIGFIATKRLDGKLILPEAVKVLQQKGTASSGS